MAYALAHSAIEPTKLYAFATGGRVWDNTLLKMASYCDLINHPDDAIRQQWCTSGENEFGQLFDGYPPNGELAEGLGVLSWIQRDKVPADKKVTYPCFVVDHQPEKKAEPFVLKSPAVAIDLTTTAM